MDETEKGRVLPPGTCPSCRHRAHGGVCLNMASDNECDCKAGRVPSLAQVVGDLQDAYVAARQHLADQITSDPVVLGGYTPETMRDTNGRFILLDALVALSAATAALNAPASSPSQQEGS